MRGRIFIAWSGNNTLALEVKKKLENERYVGVVGGEERYAGDLFVGRTVLNEISHCNQAIFIIQKKNDGSISNNLMFELGYALARFKFNKLHMFYVDVAENEIPSDLKGGWADNFYEFINECIDVIKKTYSVDKVIVFEHGANKFGSMTACGTNHSHIHIVPLNDSLLNNYQSVNEQYMKIVNGG